MWHLNKLVTLIANMSLFQVLLFTRGDSFNDHLHQLILKKQKNNNHLRESNLHLLVLPLGTFN